MDLRERVLKAFDTGMPKSVIARTFSVCRATVSNYVACRRQTGSVVPKPIPGRPAHIASAQYPALLAQLRASPDATLEEHCKMWERSQGVFVGITAMHRAIQNAGWTRKKDHPSHRAGPRSPRAVAQGSCCYP